MSETINYLQQRTQDINDNPHLLFFYADKRCKKCFGKGKLTHSIPNGLGGWANTASLCYCVRKAIKKEAKELGKTSG